MNQTAVPIKLSGSWSTQLRFTQALGRGLAALMPIDATIVIAPGRRAN